MALDHLYQETLRSVLLTGADRWPDHAAVDFENGIAWTYRELLHQACRTANEFPAHDIQPGDVVGLFMDNSPDVVRMWLGAAMAGAVVLPLNTGYRGRMLLDVLSDVRPSVIVTDQGFQERFGFPGLENFRLASAIDFNGSDAAVPDIALQPWDTNALMLTSGTTGGSKASKATNAFMMYLADYLVDPRSGITGSDVLLADMPFCHLSFLGPAIQILRIGGRVSVKTRPDLQRYWAVARESGATWSIMAGTMAEYMLRLPVADGDRDHSMALISASPLPSNPDQFRERFGVRLLTSYGLTEGGIVCVGFPGDPIPPGSCGQARAEAELRLVDENGIEVERASTGELLLRNRLPWVTGQGYVNRPDATVEAWRDQWIHTGDLLHVDDDGFYFYHDRLKDSLRRRGENISSIEVEREVLAYSGVAEAACVPSSQDLEVDDEVKIFIVANPGMTIDFDDLLRFLSDRMPYYMVPRYFEVVEEFPKTPSARVRKFDLRDMGNTARTWDREAHGYRISRQGLISTGPASTSPHVHG